jgi:hypothetical protein
MTRKPTMLQAITSLSALMLGMQAFNCYAAVEDIPLRAENRAGKLILSPRTEVQMTRVVAGYWGQKRVTLKHNGQVVWSSPPMDATISIGGRNGKDKFVRLDVDGNGRPDWLALFVPSSFGAVSSYGNDFDGTHAWSDAESQQELARPWDNMLCGWLSGMIVLDDEKTVYVFSYNDFPDPFMHRNPWVQGEKHYKIVANGTWRKMRLEMSTPIPLKIWSSVQQLIEKQACNTPDRIDKQPLPLDQRIQWGMKPEPFGLDWRPYFDDGLAMYRRAKQYYEERKADIPPEERMTKRALGVFDLHAFFEAFPFDEIDTENKSSEYTAMLNDFAFYQLAPEDANEAVGFENQRKRVEPGVVAMLALVIRRDPGRTVGYLNLADALWRNGRDTEAATLYGKYLELLRKSGVKGKPPQRVLARMKAGR